MCFGFGGVFWLLGSISAPGMRLSFGSMHPPGSGGKAEGPEGNPRKLDARRPRAVGVCLSFVSTGVSNGGDLLVITWICVVVHGRIRGLSCGYIYSCLCSWLVRVCVVVEEKENSPPSWVVRWLSLWTLGVSPCLLIAAAVDPYLKGIFVPSPASLRNLAIRSGSRKILKSWTSHNEAQPYPSPMHVLNCLAYSWDSERRRKILPPQSRGKRNIS